MKTSCEIIRDLLPLYVDDVCSPGSREMIDEHLRECPGCGDYLRQLRSGEMENGLREERKTVIRNQAKRFKRRSEVIGLSVAGVFAIPVLVSLIVNLASGRALGWFFVVAAAMAVAASLVVVPLMVPEDKLFWTFCAFCTTLVVLLAVCCLYSGGTWFYTAASAALFGLSVVGLPFAIRARPLEKLVEGRSKALLVIAVDVILFANMMNMITLRSKGLLYTILLWLFCVAGGCLLVAGGLGKEKEQ